jgi:hypothetical protein
MDYSVLWVQTPGDKFASFMISDGTTIFGKYSTGYNKLNKINPNGGIHNDISPTSTGTPLCAIYLNGILYLLN